MISKILGHPSFKKGHLSKIFLYFDMEIFFNRDKYTLKMATTINPS